MKRLLVFGLLVGAFNLHAGLFQAVGDAVAGATEVAGEAVEGAGEVVGDTGRALSGRETVYVYPHRDRVVHTDGHTLHHVDHAMVHGAEPMGSHVHEVEHTVDVVVE